MANPTTNFGWVMPTSASLVTNLPADFNVFGQAVDTSMQYLLGGTTGQVLSKTSGTNMAFTWIANDQGDLTGVTAGTGITVTSPTGPVPTVAIDTTVTVDKTTAQTLTNKTLTSPALTTPTISTATTNGDILYGTGSGALARLGIGSSAQVLTVASGIPSWSTPASGAVVQVKSATYATSTSTTSTSYVSSGLSLSITPTSASNKILCIVNMSGITARAGLNSGFLSRLRRASTAILDDNAYVTYVLATGATTTELGMPVTRVFLDSPATTSATTYDVQIKSDGGGSATVTAQWNSNTSTITLMEVTP